MQESGMVKKALFGIAALIILVWIGVFLSLKSAVNPAEIRKQVLEKTGIRAEWQKVEVGPMAIFSGVRFSQVQSSSMGKDGLLREPVLNEVVLLRNPAGLFWLGKDADLVLVFPPNKALPPVVIAKTDKASVSEKEFLKYMKRRNLRFPIKAVRVHLAANQKGSALKEPFEIHTEVGKFEILTMTVDWQSKVLTAEGKLLLNKTASKEFIQQADRALRKKIAAVIRNRAKRKEKRNELNALYEKAVVSGIPFVLTGRPDSATLKLKADFFEPIQATSVASAKKSETKEEAKSSVASKDESTEKETVKPKTDSKPTTTEGTIENREEEEDYEEPERLRY